MGRRVGSARQTPIALHQQTHRLNPAFILPSIQWWTTREEPRKIRLLSKRFDSARGRERFYTHGHNTRPGARGFR